MRQQRGATAAVGRGFLGVVGILLAACGDQAGTMTESDRQQPDNSLMRVISGEVWYRERVALPPGAEVIVTLEDQSRADAPAVVLTDYTHVVGEEQGPYSFRLAYDPSAIDERMTYGLRARILNDGDLLFVSTEHVDPFAGTPGEPIRIMASRPGGN
jgi:putative lipoprotein